MNVGATALQLQPDGSKIATAGKGWVQFQLLRPNVFWACFHGKGSVPLFEAVSEAMSTALLKGQLHCFANLTDMPDFDTEFRDCWVSWFRSNRQGMASFHVVQNSVLVKIGLSMVNIALGGMVKTYRDVTEFEQALKQALG